MILSSTALRLVVGQLVSQVCDKMMTVGLVWILLRGHPASVVPAFLAVSALPHLLLVRHSGLWISAWGPLRAVIGTDLARGALFVAAAGAWSQVPDGGQTELVALFALSFVSNLAGALFNPAILSLPLQLVGLEKKNELQRLTALIDACFSFGTVLGPLASALLFPRLGLRGLLLVNGLSYGWAAALSAGIRLNRPSVTDPAPGENAPPMGWVELLRQDHVLRTMLAGFLAINLFLAPLMVFLPLFVKQVYQGSIGTLANLEAWLGAGTVAGGVLLSVFPWGGKTGPKMSMAMGGVALAYVGFALSSRAGVGAVLLGILGISLSIVNVLALQLFQSRPPESQVPRVMSGVNLISVASLPFSMGALSWILGVAGIGGNGVEIRRLALICGGILSGVTILVALQRDFRKV